MHIAETLIEDTLGLWWYKDKARLEDKARWSRSGVNFQQRGDEFGVEIREMVIGEHKNKGRMGGGGIVVALVSKGWRVIVVGDDGRWSMGFRAYTLHRIWKKEHDWGWKKFMELSKVLDGFSDADTLIFKAQVQVLRERAYCPFRCLDCQYSGELVRDS
ncbi:hypothetical protein RHGRI_017375 [Rhododendron griersonianum]|uniref:MATH domain-containing protein n=1 Tax=Rhododendron griersonianum TaxID=479676 RepID=A0AAV6JXN0_9ERIC|nr:hypothetical protein RHGRI_017375 [Rhododendron griersonianum]